MSDFVREVLAYLGYERLTLDFDERTRSRVMTASVLPALIIAALLVQLYVEYRYDAFSFSEDVPEFWRRAAAVAFVTQEFALPLAVAVLVASGMRAWSRAAGSWMVLIGLALLVLSAGFGVSSLTLIATTGTEEAFVLRAQRWYMMAYTFGFLAIGYFFVAHRAGHPRPARRRYRRPRRKSLETEPPADAEPA